MSNYPLPVRAVAYKFEMGLIDQSNTKLLKSNPTLASGDAKVAKDDGALANLTTLPYSTNTDRRVEVALSATEMTADNVSVIMSDAAGAEWCDQFVNIQTATRGIDDLAFPTVSGRSIDVAATGEVGLDFTNRLDTTGILPNVVAGGNGGLFIAGSNAATSITTALTANLIGNITGNLSGSVASVTAAVKTTYYIHKNTQAVAFPFVMTLAADGSPATGLTVTAQRSLDGAAFAGCANAVTELALGWYLITLAAADLNANTVALHFTAPTANPLPISIITQT